jgi:hypothetical protein
MKRVKKQNTEEILNDPSSFVPIHDMKASFFIAEREDSEKIMLRLDEGRYKGIIIELKDFLFKDENSSLLTFDMNVVYSPTGKIPNEKNLELIVKKLAKKIIEYAIRTAMIKDEESKFVNIEK